MNAKADYCEWVRINSSTWERRESATERIASLYQSARVGSMSLNVAVGLLDDVFAPLRIQILADGFASEGFDEFAIDQITALAGKLSTLTRGNLGAGQKLFNLFMKDHWALNSVPGSVETHLHVPIDRRLIDQFNECPAGWRSWTKVNLSDRSVAEYRQIQEYCRDHWRWGGVFASPIEMEHYWWRGVGPIPERQ